MSEDNKKDLKKKTPIYIKLLGGFVGIIIGVSIQVAIFENSEHYLLVYALMAGGYYGADMLYKNK